MYNQVTDIDGLKSLVGLRDLRFDYNQVSNLSPVSRLTKLQILAFCYNPYTDISPIASLSNALHIRLDKAFEELAKTLVSAETNIIACPLLPEPEPELRSEPESETEVMPRRSIARCGLGWAPQSQFPHHGELPKVMIYALEFEYDPERHGRYICKTIEIRTGG